MDNDDDKWGFLLQDSEEVGPSTPLEEVISFCQDPWLENFDEEIQSKATRRAAWLDDRCLKGVRKHQNPLSAAQLYEHLKTPVSESPQHATIGPN